MQCTAIHHGLLAAVDVFFPGVVSQESSFYMWELPVFALIATLGGLLGAGFVGVSKRLALFRAQHLAGARRRFAEASYFEAYSERGGCYWTRNDARYCTQKDA